MIFGFAITLTLLAVGGLIMLPLFFLQLATGMRWIKLPPRKRIAIHKTAGIVLVVIALVHGAMGLIMATGLRIG